MTTDTDDEESNRWNELARRIAALDQDKNLGIKVEWKDPETPIFKARSKVGHLVFESDEWPVTRFTIRPKVEGSVTGMLRVVMERDSDLLDRSRELLFEERVVGQNVQPSAWLAALYSKRLEQFLSRIRSRGVEQTEELEGHIRGRPLVSRYVKQNYWTSPTRMPCRYFEWTEDNLPNRILRYAVSVAQRAVRPYGSGEQETLGRLRRCDSHLGAVERVRIQPGDFRRVRPMLRGPFRAYGSIVELAEFLIRAIDPFEDAGPQEHRHPAVRAFESGQSTDGKLRWDLVDMPSLFEEYVRAITRGGRGGSKSLELEGGDPTRVLEGLKEKNLFTDRDVFKSEGLVLDAKYKNIGSLGGSETDHDDDGRIHLQEYKVFNPGAESDQTEEDDDSQGIKSSDLYQVLAYATHKEITANRAALVYPVDGEGGEEPGKEPPYYKNLGHFSDSEDLSNKGDGGIPIYICTVRIDKEGILERKGEGLLKQLPGKHL